MTLSRYFGIPLLTAASLAVSLFLLTIQSADAGPVAAEAQISITK